MEHAHLDAVLTTFQCSNPPRIRDCSAHVPKQACSGRDEISLQSKSRSDRGAELIDHSVSVGLQTDDSCEGSHSLSDHKPRTDIGSCIPISMGIASSCGRKNVLSRCIVSVDPDGVLAIDGQIWGEIVNASLSKHAKPMRRSSAMRPLTQLAR